MKKSVKDIRENILGQELEEHCGGCGVIVNDDNDSGTWITSLTNSSKREPLCSDCAFVG